CAAAAHERAGSFDRLCPGRRRSDLRVSRARAAHRARPGRSFPRPTLVRIAEASGGNPLYALEIARLVEGGGGGASLPVPEDVRALVARRVAALPEATRDALLRTASLARPDVTLVDERALEPAEEAELVRVDARGRIAFAHPLFASAVYAAAPH